MDKQYGTHLVLVGMTVFPPADPQGYVELDETPLLQREVVANLWYHSRRLARRIKFKRTSSGLAAC